MIKKMLALSCLLAFSAAWAEDAKDALAFTEASPLSTLIERIPGIPLTLPWLPVATVHRYDATRFNDEKSMLEVHQLYGQWCKAQSGRILQPRDSNCTILRNRYACAVGELQYPGLNSDFELGFKDAASAATQNVRVGWPNAVWLVSENVIFNLFVNKGANEVSIVGGLQRCMIERKKFVSAMAFVSIDGNHDLLFFNEQGYDAITRRGAELSKLAADKKMEEARRKKEQETARLAALGAGDAVIHLKTGLRGMIIEMKPPLAQIQWDKGFGSKSVEWNRLEELSPDKPR